VAVSNLTIDKRSPFSIQRQLATQLVYLIRSGSLKPGEQLPTTRQLAGYLRINHNTVAMAYRDLEAQGLLRVEQGRGTFVTEAAAGAADPKRQALEAIVREAYDRARPLGATGEEFLEVAGAVVRRAEAAGGARPGLLLVECNESEVGSMESVLAPELAARVSTATIDELSARLAGGRGALEDTDLILTTFFHVNEVEALTEGTGVKVAGLYMGPSIRTLMRIMALEPTTRIAAVGKGPACVRGLVASLQNVLGTDRPIAFGHVQEPAALGEVIAGSDVVVYGEATRKTVEPLISARHEQIAVENHIDRGSIEMVKELLADLARRKAAVAGGSV
jgi:DNA-binding transcriptional regulator YhcF (GntR family)